MPFELIADALSLERFLECRHLLRRGGWIVIADAEVEFRPDVVKMAMRRVRPVDHERPRMNAGCADRRGEEAVRRASARVAPSNEAPDLARNSPPADGNGHGRVARPASGGVSHMRSAIAAAAVSLLLGAAVAAQSAAWRARTAKPLDDDDRAAASMLDAFIPRPVTQHAEDAAARHAGHVVAQIVVPRQPIPETAGQTEHPLPNRHVREVSTCGRTDVSTARFRRAGPSAVG